MSAAGADDRERALDFALRRARAAGDVLLAHYEKLDKTSIRTKSVRRDLVTAADLAAEQALVPALREAFPDDAIHAEESSRATSASGGAWFIDPLDGTTNFVHGLPEFTVSVARFFDGKPQVAVVHAPRLGETYSAAAGLGAYRNGERIRVSRASELADSLLATGFPYRRAELKHNNLANFERLFLKVRDLRRLGSAALDLAFVACGRFDGYWELHLERHDVAAGGLLVLEAGGRVTDVSGGDAWPGGASIVATNGAIHEELRALIVA